VAIRNNVGSITLLAITLLMIATGTLILSLRYAQKNYWLQKNLIKQNLCIKEYLGKTHQVLVNIEKLNRVIKASYALQMIPKVQYLVKKIKLIQNIIFISYLKNLTNFSSSSCQLNLIQYMTPLNHQLGILTRNQFGETTSRTNQWQYLDLKPLKLQITLMRLITSSSKVQWKSSVNLLPSTPFSKN